MAEPVRYASFVADNQRWDGFELRSDDIVISTPSKCGTTWMQTLVSMLVLGEEPLDRPLAEISLWLDMLLDTRDDVVARLDAQQHRRFIKTHTPLDGLPFDPRVRFVFVGRDPRDRWMSWEHHMENLEMGRFLSLRSAVVGDEPAGPPPPAPLPTFSERFRRFVDGGVDFGDTLEQFVHHARTFWDRRDEPNTAMFHYADLLGDLPTQIRRLATFLGVDVDDDAVGRMAARATFASMKDNAEQLAPNTNHQLWKENASFFHRGTSGQWREHLDDNDVAYFETRLRELAGDDLARWIEFGSSPPS